MDLNKLRSELRKLAALADGWSAPDDISAVERELALEKLRMLYDLVRFPDEEAQPASDEVAPVLIPEGIELEDMLLIDTDADAVDAAPFAIPGAHAEGKPEAGDETTGDFEAAGDEAPECAGDAEFESAASAGDSENGAEPEVFPEPEEMPVSDAAPSLVSEPDTVSEPKSEAESEPKSKPEPEPEPKSEAESEAESRPEPKPEPEPEFEPEPGHPAETDSDAGGAIPDPITSELPVSAESETPAVSAPEAAASEPATVVMPSLFGPEEETARHRRKQRIIMSLYGASEPETPAKPTRDGIFSPRREVPESEAETAGEDQSGSVGARPGVVSSVATELPGEVPAEVSEAVESDPVPEAVESESDSVSVPARESAPEPETESAEGTEPEFEELTLDEASATTVGADASAEHGDRPAGAVLGEVMNHGVQTLADTIAPPNDVASELRRSEPVTDLRRAIGINDKFLLVRDLFDGDVAACDAALDTLNGFDDLDDCMIYIAEHYAWNADSDGAKFLMELLERKYA